MTLQLPPSRGQSSRPLVPNMLTTPSAALHRAGIAILLQVVSLDSPIAIYIAWIVAQTGLSAPDHPPIHFVTPAEMAIRHGSPENSGLELQALYNRNEGSIYLPQEWRTNDLRQKSALLHELVHHVQRFNKMELSCLAALERQAYDLQIKWLREQGVNNPYDQNKRAQHLLGKHLS
ncbi:DUF6647 family protein [Bradyrhizobium australiense]|uniref:DUF6647 domain-containing protein n=1 Tax=Bradyrhizobium australiense TaxID=2721161 RepID=A0A7Y4GMJ7_9BRAD|nr:DUF6647 family protein [Bradyrhizobium australiense]NOJ38411.1 hypothetical protein [Bradyrhizobium australiense]